jgi:hypothetical protein
MDGNKFDAGKVDWTLINFNDLEETARVLMFGENKYSRDSWKTVEKDRFVKALLRHVIQYANGEQQDTESSYNHLSHAIANCLFILNKDKQGE